MTIAYNWTITQTDYITADGYITTAHWTANAVWAEGTPTIPYADVTQAEVLEWCWDSGVDKDATEAALAQNIANQKNPPVSQGLPWAAPAEASDVEEPAPPVADPEQP